MGLVENTGRLRVLSEPISVTRNGVTVTITNVLAYPDRVELIYEINGIAASNDGWQASDSQENPTAFCGGVNIGKVANKDGDARLKLPDGTLLERDYTGLYPQNAFAMKPVYQVSLPADLDRITMVLKCLPMARLGAVPENWEIPFELKSVPADEVVGETVLDVEQTAVGPDPLPDPIATIAPGLPTPVVTMKLENVVPGDERYIFYFSMDMENRDPSLISIMPITAYVIDSLGQKIQLIGNFPWQPFEHRVGSAFQFTSQSKPAAGPLTLVVEKAVAYYAPLYTEPPQATPDEMSFTFDAGENPQRGQTWHVDREFEIAGYPVHVLSARAVTFEDLNIPNLVDGSQGYEYGYEFAVQTDPSVKMLMWMDIMTAAQNCWLSNAQSNVPDSSSISFIQLCRDEFPKSNVRVTIGELSVLLENTWQTVWNP